MTDERCSILYLLPCFSPGNYFLIYHLLDRLLVAFLEWSIINYLTDLKMVPENNKYYLIAICFANLYTDYAVKDRGKTIREHRISAGATIMQGEKILLVRYNDGHGGSYLVGPGGGVHSGEESMTQALNREVKEETGLDIDPVKLLFVEEFFSISQQE